jgi:hypothetical protein
MIHEALTAYAKQTARVFVGRANTIGASDVGQCARKVFFQKNEGDPDCGAERNPDFVDGWGARQRGTTFENAFWAPALRARFGDRLLFAGEEQQTLTSGFVSGTPDGLVVGLEPSALAEFGLSDIGGDQSLVIEAKTIDPRARLDGPKPEHVFQAQVQLGLIHELTSHRPKYALISYTDASFWDLVTEFLIERDPVAFEAARQRARMILTARAATELAPEGWIAGGRECELCAFSSACGVERTRVPQPTTVPPDPQFVAEVADLAREAKRLELTADNAMAAYRAMQHEIKERLRARGFRRIAGDGVTVVWSPVKGRQSWDHKAIREAAAAAGIDILQFETVGEPTDRLDIRLEQSSTRRQ